METLVLPDGNELSAVAFDMDGVVFDTESIYQAATIEALDHLGYPYGPELAETMVGRTESQCADLLRQAFGDAFPMDDFGLRYRFGRDALLGEEIPVNPYVPDTLERLRERRIPTALVTNGRRDVTVRRLARAGLLEYFQVVVTSDDVDDPKPAPDVYLCAAARLSVRPRHAVALEDSMVGVRAATGAGFYTIRLGGYADPVGADAVGADAAAAARLFGLRVRDRIG
ncbi:HAD family phosphatase [Plantactinospora sp. KBS50]|uniref:HAD family hydrolase n=1 Tax=Plantactinospora sp. KBS50 TaxID=2024580 RepID=UPI000BAB235B|nr:HAD family phosphatase [Plantactinospora sp. KBS50]ASW55792.1 hypothetical protein CIK06_18830 [Plantactinospora sp. KBS50]